MTEFGFFCNFQIRMIYLFNETLSIQSHIYLNNRIVSFLEYW